MRTIIVISFFCLLLGNCYRSAAQDSDVKHPCFAIKWSPVHLAYFYPSFQVAIEHKIFKNMNLQYDLGYVLDYGNDSEDYNNKRGFRGLGEIRYYIPSPPKIPFYIAGEFYYSRINFDRSQVAGYDCETGDCSYFEYFNYKVENHHQGAGLKFGVLLFPGWNRNRSFFFDINGGFAYRNISYIETGKPSGTDMKFFGNDNVTYTLFTPDEDTRSSLRLVLGVRLGYRFF